MEREPGTETSGAVMPLTLPRPDAVVIPFQRGPSSATVAGAPGIAERDPISALPAELSAMILSLDSPDRFFSGVMHALWMSVAVFALAVGVLVATGALG